MTETEGRESTLALNRFAVLSQYVPDYVPTGGWAISPSSGFRAGFADGQ